MNTKKIEVSDLPEVRKFVEDTVSSGHRFRKEFEEAEELPRKKKKAERAGDLASFSWTVVIVLIFAFGFWVVWTGNQEIIWVLLGLFLGVPPLIAFALHMQGRARKLEDNVFVSYSMGTLASKINYLLELFDIEVKDLPWISSTSARERLTSQALRILEAQEDARVTGGFQGGLEVGCENQTFKQMFDTFKYFGFISEDQKYGPFFEEAKKRMLKSA